MLASWAMNLGFAGGGTPAAPAAESITVNDWFAILIHCLAAVVGV